MDIFFWTIYRQKSNSNRNQVTNPFALMPLNPLLSLQKRKLERKRKSCILCVRFCFKRIAFDFLLLV